MTSWLTDRYASGNSSATMSRIRRSCAGFRNDIRQQIATASTPPALSSRAAARTSSSSSGTSTSPDGARIRSVTGSRQRRLTRGLACLGTSCACEKLNGRSLRPMCSTSRKPRVVISPTLAPFRSSRMFVATVVPCTRKSSASGALPASSSRARSPARPASDGSSGVEGSLWITTAPLSSSRKTRSVKVPPMSIPTRCIESPDRYLVYQKYPEIAIMST